MTVCEQLACEDRGASMTVSKQYEERGGAVAMCEQQQYY